MSDIERPQYKSKGIFNKKRKYFLGLLAWLLLVKISKQEVCQHQKAGF